MLTTIISILFLGFLFYLGYSKSKEDKEQKRIDDLNNRILNLTKEEREELYYLRDKKYEREKRNEL